MPGDPIVEEVRAAREAIFAECDYDLHKLMLRSRRVLKRWTGPVVTREDLARRRARASRRPARKA